MQIDGSLQNTYTQMASMKRINQASDDAAGLAISQKMISSINGYATATANVQTAGDLAATAGGGLSSMQGSLQRMRELAVQASNGTYTADDRKVLQDEIAQLKSSISQVSQGTEFNTIKLLDGSFSDQSIASTPYGTGRSMSIQNTSLQSLGIDAFDVTGTFDISDIDNAMAKISDAQGNVGATSNALQYEAEINATAQENLTAAESGISDADIAQLSMTLKNQQMIQQYQYFAQQKNMEQKSGILNLLR